MLEDDVNLSDCCFNIIGNNNSIIIKKSVLAKTGEFFIEDDNNSIFIGSNTKLCGKIHLACIEGTNITIGANCLFSSEILCQTGDAHTILNAEMKRVNPSKSICIDDHVWVGARVIIGKGASVSKNTIIGYGTVVTSKFEESNVVIAGIPAKVIKENTSWDIQRIPIT